ncbi:MAG: hypothetical protein KBA31_06245 [Alphaproteobacteria bacterium]|nr:hypothetical protein [Alphaproteobacteria bacterium]
MAANVTQSIFDVTSAAGAQFLAMIIGAFLASTGGFLVTWLLDRMARKRQERSIALVCLDLLSSLSVLTNLAKDARSRGTPYGPYTMRLVRSCMRDLDVYERNRERIADISDPNARAEIYQCMARMTLAIEGVLAESEMIARSDGLIEAARTVGDLARVEELTLESKERQGRRDISFGFMVDTTEELCGPLSIKLRAIAKSEQQNLAAIVAANAQAASSVPEKLDD